jgi:CRP-like cAMP-binding protein
MTEHIRTPERASSLRNRLLRALSPDQLELLMPSLTHITLHPRQILHVSGTPMQDVYFVERGLVTVSAQPAPGTNVEVWLVGSEGMTGLPVVLGDEDRPPLQRVVQIGGEAYRISRANLRRALHENDALRSLLLRYVQFVLLQAAQESACNAAHDLKQRLARWLLLARDALGQDEIGLTHRTLARLLGVRRASVTDCLRVLADGGAVRTTRGVIIIEDAAKLRSAACSCYGLIRREYKRLTGNHPVGAAPGLGND